MEKKKQREGETKRNSHLKKRETNEIGENWDEEGERKKR